MSLLRNGKEHLHIVNGVENLPILVKSPKQGGRIVVGAVFSCVRFIALGIGALHQRQGPFGSPNARTEHKINVAVLLQQRQQVPSDIDNGKGSRNINLDLTDVCRGVAG